MTPDDQLSHDFKLGFIVCLLLVLVTISAMNAGYSPVDDCANAVNDSLSPYKKSVLTNQALPIKYMQIAEWCIDHIDGEAWRDELRKAQMQVEPENDYLIPEDYTY